MNHRPRAWKRAIVIAALAISTVVLGLAGLAGPAHAGTTAPDTRITSVAPAPDLGLTTGTSSPVKSGIHNGYDCDEVSDGWTVCRLVWYFCNENGCWEL
jgi:hypothetical protein